MAISRTIWGVFKPFSVVGGIAHTQNSLCSRPFELFELNVSRGSGIPASTAQILAKPFRCVARPALIPPTEAAFINCNIENNLFSTCHFRGILNYTEIIKRLKAARTFSDPNSAITNVIFMTVLYSINLYSEYPHDM